MEKILLKCGCMSNARGRQAGSDVYVQSCVIHDCFEPAGYTPDVSGRRMRCFEFGRPTHKSECRECGTVCTCERPSKLNAAFFEHKPDEDFDVFYCGCHSWD